MTLLMTTIDSATAQGPEPIRYTLRFPAPHTHYLEVEAVYPTGGRPQVDLMMAVWTPGSYLVREYERHVEGLIAKDANGRALAVDQAGQEPLAREYRRRRHGHRELSRLRPRDDRAQQLGRGRLRDAERRADLHHAGRSDAASARGAHRAAGGVEGLGHGADADRRPGPRLSSRGLRHAGRQPDRARQPGGEVVRGRRQGPSPGARGRPVVLRRRPGRGRLAQDRGSGHGGDGTPRLSALLLPQHGRRDRRRARTQELVPDHVEPLRHPHPPAVHQLAEPGGARVLPQLEHQAPAAGGARTLRLRDRELHQEPVGGRGRHRLLRGAAGPARRADHDARVPRHALDHDRGGADAAGPPGAVGGDGLVRHVDQAVPTRREQPQHQHRLLRQGRHHRVPARRDDPPGDERRQDARRRDAAGLSAPLGRQGLHARGVPEGDERDGWAGPLAVVRAGSDHHRGARFQSRRSTGSGSASPRSIRRRRGRPPACSPATTAAGWWCRRCDATRRPTTLA